MAATPSTMVPLGTAMPAFDLPDFGAAKDGSTRVSNADAAGSKATLVMFICNHCPFVHHIQPELVKVAAEYEPRGVRMIAINANDAATHPGDAPDKMASEAARLGYTFPYLYDESQAVAKAFSAACTPDFFVYGARRELVYRGQLDSSRPGNGEPVTGSDLRAALDAAVAGGPPLAQQHPSIGCNIKWKPGNEPAV